jgi:hypothetical protein
MSRGGRARDLLSSSESGPERGNVFNLGAGGLLLEGPLPDSTWIPELIKQKIVVGVKLSLPTEAKPIGALCRVAWIDGSKGASDHNQFGLAFREISGRDKDAIFEYIIHGLMR